MQDDSPPEELRTNDADEPDSDRSTRRTFLKGAAGAGATLVGTGLSGSAAADGPLVVDDYEESSQWSSGQNDLGNWTGAGGWQSQDVSGGTLTLEYQDNAWYKTKVYQDVSAYDRVAIEARGATGSEAQDIELTLGNTTDTLANLSGQSLGDSFTTLTIPFSEVSFDATTQSTLTLNAPWGTSGTIELEELRFETAGSSAPKPEPEIDGLPTTATVGEYVQVYSAYDPQTSTVMAVEWEFGDGSTSRETSPTHAWDSAGEYQVTLTYTFSDDATKSTTQSITVEPSTAVADVSLEYEELNADGDFTVQLTLENTELVARSDVDAVRVDNHDDLDLNPYDATGFQELDDGTWQLTEDTGTATLHFTRSLTGIQEFTEDIDDIHLYHLETEISDFDPTVTVDAAADTSVEKTYGVAGDGFVDEAHDVLFFGRGTQATGDTAQGPLALVYPDYVDVTTSPDRALEGLSEVADAYYSDHETEAVTGIRLEGGQIEDAGGLGGDREFCLKASDVNTPSSLWIHEYAHTLENVRQENRDDSFIWHGEATAEYRALLAPLELEHGSYDTAVFENNTYDQFYKGVSHPEDVVNLKNPETYGHGVGAGGPEYTYGPMVLFAIDHRIRQTTTDSTVFDVFEHMYDVDRTDGDSDPVYDLSLFLSAIETVSDATVKSDARDWLTNEVVPDLPEPEAFSEAFGFDVPAPGVQSLSPIVNGTKEPAAATRTRVTPSDAVALAADVENFGTKSVTITLQLQAEGSADALTTEQVTLDAGESQTVSFQVDPSTDAPTYSGYDVEMESYNVETPWIGGESDTAQAFVFLESDATLVRYDDDTTQGDPAHLDQGTTLALLRGGPFLKEFRLEQVDGDDSMTFYPDVESLHFGHLDASKLVAGATYAVHFPRHDRTQYVTVGT